uniref:Major facilitator superfamily (MFS) profile domain-containing protein n=1 Tax=Aegilops tauschii subsp. strangulata TaxID=200361 RepID=A0A453C3V0_AEGTS
MARGGLAPAVGGDRIRSYGGGRVTLSVVVTCLMAASCGLIFGYDIGVSGAHMLEPNSA